MYTKHLTGGFQSVNCKQGIEDQQSMLGNHDLDEFFHDHEPILITN